jgi:capsular polysaccharide biosynthesis protein
VVFSFYLCYINNQLNIYVMSDYKKIAKAKQVLEDNGYFVGNLWTVSDVKSKFDCTDDEAQEVLDKALTNEATMEQVWFSITEFGNIFNLKPIGDE